MWRFAMASSTGLLPSAIASRHGRPTGAEKSSFSVTHFSIEQWRAWAPGLETADAWRTWCAEPFLPDLVDAQPDVAFLPAMQRRRLSRLARMAMSVAWPLVSDGEQVPMVFASRHGETPRTLALLQDLARGEPLSPTQFSLSVHNAVIGQWSILRGDTSEMTAVAAEGDGLEHALLEAAGLLADGAPAVLLVITEESPPDLYRPLVDDVPFAYALALRLVPGHDWSLTLAPAPAEATPAAWPHALGLLQALHLDLPRIQHHWKSRTWTWQRNRP